MKFKIQSLTMLASAAVALVVASGAHAVTGPVIEGTIPTQVNGTVEGVNLAARTVQVRDAQGNVSAMQVGADVPNLDKLKFGTKVTGTIQRPIALTPVAANALPAPVNGQQPLVVKVDSADSGTGIVNVSDAQGTKFAILARNPVTLNGLKTGTRAVVSLPDPHSLDAQPLR